MKNRILLIEPSYKVSYPPLGLMKIAKWHKKNKDYVDFNKDGLANDHYFGHKNTKLRKHYDIIYITSLFTYHFDEVIKSIKLYQEKYPKAVIKVGGILASLLPELIKKETSVCPHIGLLDGPENCSPDYSLFPDFPASIVFTTRGCKNNCKFCAVKKHEPRFYPKEDWERDIDRNKRMIIFWDNNWLMSSNFTKDVEMLKKLNMRFDFNQGLDCRLFDKEKAKLMSETMIGPLRFAFDNHSVDGHIQKAIKIAKRYGFKDIRVYILYNSEDPKDTPEYFYYRINEINKLGALSYPMRYRSITNTNIHFKSPHWDRKILRAVKLCTLFYYSHGMIRRNIPAFKKIFGKNRRHFKNRMLDVYKYDQELKCKREKAKREKKKEEQNAEKDKDVG